MRLTAALAGLWIGLALAVPAAAQGWTGTGESVDDLRYRLGILDAELADIRARLQALGAGGGAVAPGAPSLGGDAGVRLDRLEGELRRLTGMLEEVEFRQRQIAEDAARRFGDIEFRLTELEGGDISAVAAPEPLGGTAVSPRAPAPTAPQIASTPRAGGGTGEIDLAIADIQQGRFDQGEARLEGVLSADPRNPRSAEAQFWLGRSKFVRGEFAEAARRHLAGYNTDRSGPMAARNLLQLGITLGRLGQTSEACLTLREVARQFPGQSELVNAADAERDSLACPS